VTKALVAGSIRWKGCAGGAIRTSARMGTNAAANNNTSPDRASLTLTAVALNPAPARSLWRLERRQWVIGYYPSPGSETIEIRNYD